MLYDLDDIMDDFVVEPKIPKVKHSIDRSNIEVAGDMPWERHPVDLIGRGRVMQVKTDVDNTYFVRKEAIERSKEAHKAVNNLPVDLQDKILDAANVMRPRVIFKAK